ncbi:MAG: hypothetical protein ABFR62_09165 [Bacteroidota bacterium]
MLYKAKYFKGAGYLIGFAVGAVVAIIFVALTGINALIGAIAGAIAISTGIILEKKFQGNTVEYKSKERNIFIILIFFGLAMLALFYYLTLR